MSPDLINGAFEGMASLFILNHCRVLVIDKSVRGVSVLSCAFFTLWGFWNLYFYPAVGQAWSFWGGVLVVLANTIYVLLLVYFAQFYDTYNGFEDEMQLNIDLIGDKR